MRLNDLKYLLLYRKLKEIKQYDTSLIVKFYQDFFIGHGYIRKETYYHLKKRIHRTKRILKKPFF